MNKQETAKQETLALRLGGYGWQSFATDAATRRIIGRLALRGLVEINRFGQYRKRPGDRDTATGIVHR